jgi:hypothetical protein
MDQAISYRPLALEVRFQSRTSRVRFVVSKVAVGQVLLIELRFSPVGTIPKFSTPTFILERKVETRETSNKAKIF